MVTRAPPRLGRYPSLPVGLGCAVLLVPSVVTLGARNWSGPSGAQGPIMLAVAGWLFASSLRALPSGVGGDAALVPLVVALLGYAIARSLDVQSIEIAALIAVLLALIARHISVAALWACRFAALFAALLIPLPTRVTLLILGPLKTMVSAAAVALLHGAGYPITRDGVRLIIPPYQLLVEDACAGLNSAVSLIALGLVYIHSQTGRRRTRTLLLLLAIVPVALFANLIRVIVLVLLTYYVGDGIAQSAAHSGTGLILFGVALTTLYALDQMLIRCALR